MVYKLFELKPVWFYRLSTFLVYHLKIRRFVNSGRTGSIPVSVTKYPWAFQRSSAHLFNVNWKSDTVLVPYRGAGPAGLAVATGEADVGYMTTTGLMNYHHMCTVKILAVILDKRLLELPSVPKMV